MFTDHEKEIAKRIVENEDMINLIKKVFVEPEEKIAFDIIKEKSNAELGEIVRANTVAEEKIRNRLIRLKNLALSSKSK